MDFVTIFKTFGPSVGFLIVTLIILNQLWKYFQKREDKHTEALKEQEVRYQTAIDRLVDEKKELEKENRELYQKNIDIALKSQEALGKVLPYLRDREN